MFKKLVLGSVALLAIVSLTGFTPGGPSSASVEPANWDDVLSAGEVVSSTEYMIVRQGNDWTTFEYKDRLQDPVQIWHQGERVGNTCVFIGVNEGSGQSGVVSVQREIASNLIDCQMLIESGTQSATKIESGESEKGNFGYRFVPDPNTITGRWNGTYSGAWTTSKSGGCSNWLSFQSHVGTS